MKNTMRELELYSSDSVKDIFDSIVGYGSVRCQMEQMIEKYENYTSKDANREYPIGVAFTGVNGAANDYIAYKYALATHRYVLLCCKGSESIEETFKNIKNRIDEIKKNNAEKVTMFLPDITNFTLDELMQIIETVESYFEDTYIVATIEKGKLKGNEVRAFCDRFITDYIMVYFPDERATKEYLNYLIRDRYKLSNFNIDMEELLDIYRGLSFSEMNFYFGLSVIQEERTNSEISVDCLISPVLKSICTDDYREYSDGCNFRAGVDVAGGAIVDYLLKKDIRGFWGLNGNGHFHNTGYYERGYNPMPALDVMNDVRILLAAWAADILYEGAENATFNPLNTITTVKEIIMDCLTVRGLYGLEYVQLSDSEAYKAKVDEKAHEILQNTFSEVMDLLTPYREVIIDMAKQIKDKGYILMTEVRKAIEEYDLTREGF